MARLTFYFSFRSPFAAIAFYRLRRAPQFRDVDIDLVPLWPELIFGGHMDNPTDNLFKMAYIFHDAARQAQVAGLDPRPFEALAVHFSLPETADYASTKRGVPVGEEHWDLPHIAFMHADARGQGWAFGDAVFSRRFGLNGAARGDVQQADVISELAEQCGLQGDAVAGAAASGEYADLLTQHVKSSERHGVFGVPFFVLEKDGELHRYWGNDRLEYVLKDLEGSAELVPMPASSLQHTVR